MIHFVVVTGQPLAVARLSTQLLPSLLTTRYFAGAQTLRTGTHYRWAIAAIEAPDPLAPRRLAYDEHRAIVVNGPAFASDERPGVSLADRVLAEFACGGGKRVATTLTGAYNFVGVGDDDGLCAFSDFSGLFPLYWHRGRDFTAVSNRASTLAVLGGDTDWDVHALSWLVSQANLFGDTLPHRSVSYLPTQHQLQVTAHDTEPIVSRSPNWVWPAADSEARERLDDEAWNAVTETLVGNFRALRSLDGRIRMTLTGGKDTRLCLALAKAAGLADKVVTFTNGPPDSPEVECAHVVAEAAGVEHRQIGRVLEAPTPAAFDAQLHWQRLRQHAYRFDATVCPWDGMTGLERGTSLTVKGFGGELYRRAHAKRFRDHSLVAKDAMLAAFDHFHDPFDALAALTPDERRRQVGWLRAWAETAASEVRVDMLPDKFYADYRIGHWNGPLGQAVPGRISLNPLLAPAAAIKAYELSLPARGTDRFHYEVMRRTAPELLPVPFLADRWPDAIIETSDTDLPREPFASTVRVTSRALTPGKWSFFEHEERAIGRLLKDARRTAMAEVFDMKRLVAAGSSASQLRKVGEIQALYSAILIAIVLLGREEQVVDEPQT